MAQLIKASTYNELVANMLFLGDATPLLDTLIMRLYQAGPTPSPDMTAAQFTSCDFTGYADDTVTMNDPHSEADGTWSMTSGLGSFLCSGTTTLNTVKGVMAFAHSDTTKFIGAADFDNPVPISGVGSGLSCAVVVNSGAASENDEAIVIV